jgi:ubiquinone/menaquinone biosynthesis C-methylase UbiE
MPRFINPSAVLAHTDLKAGDTVADLGCGSGFYTIPAAQAVKESGKVYAVDIQESKLAVTQSTARQLGCHNITVVKADLDKPLLDIPEGSCDIVITASILHEIGSRDGLLKNAYRLLKTGGKVLVVEWKKEIMPLGPAQELRVAPASLEAEFTHAGLRKLKDIPADSFHYAMLFTK